MVFNSFFLHKLVDIQGINPAIFTMMALKTSLRAGWHARPFTRKNLSKSWVALPNSSSCPARLGHQNLYKATSTPLRPYSLPRRGCHLQTRSGQGPRPHQELQRPAGAQPAVGTRSTEGSRPPAPVRFSTRRSHPADHRPLPHGPAGRAQEPARPGGPRAPAAHPGARGGERRVPLRPAPLSPDRDTAGLFPAAAAMPGKKEQPAALARLSGLKEISKNCN
ncbi:translation initiation factor IF-2-like isoform X2 [Motacilla alba alba]|uniref:translation initiation factor IF-2-like isoform X2 n=1 Tax=Motacilla alba alba TaxID=1094192 RepID=UPI0018D524A3|nr:translation initiation factor IF-2-like isoform X2 [Motacilla alba alba]